MNQTKAVTDERDQEKTPPAGYSAGPETLLQVDLWTDSLPSDVALAGVDETPVPSLALAMVSDLIAVGGGELRESSSASMTASFKDSVAAVNAARHLQRLIKGFSRASEAGPLYACFTLRDAGEANSEANAGFSRSYSLKQAQSGQVLLVGSICESARSIPGLQFKVLPVGMLDSDSSGLQRIVLQLLPPLHMDGYVDEPPEIAPVAKTKPRAAKPEISAKRVSIPSERPLVPQKEAGPASVMPASRPISSPSREVPASASGSESPRTQIKPGWTILGVAGVAVVAGILIFVPMLKKSAKPAPQPTQNRGRPTPSIEGAVAPASIPPAVIGKSDSGSVESGIPVKDTNAAHGRTALHAATGAAEIKQEASARIGGQHGLTFSGDEISSLISRADKHAGDGDYDRAILEYKTVLNQEPSNALAKRGLARALYNKNHK